MNSRATPQRVTGSRRGPRPSGAVRPSRGSGALSVKPFRRLWTALSLSSLGDWLSIVALTALAPSLSGKGTGAEAVSGVWIVTLLPALLFGPLAGAIADRLDRRMTMIIGDVLRGLLYVSIPLFPNLGWIYAAKFLAGVITLFWAPATNATIPNLVPKDKLERANQLSLITTYGTAPVAAGLFSVLALVSSALGTISPYFRTNNIDLALYFNAASYGVSALTVFLIRDIPKRRTRGEISAPSALRSIWEGWRYMGQTRAVRGLVIGMFGAFCAAGAIIGLGYSYITETLHGGTAGWGMVFAAVFVGLALGMVPATRLVKDFSRRRLFGLAIVCAAVALALVSIVPNLVFVTLFVVIIGAMAGVAYSTGFTIVGLEVDDDTRGRVFAFFQSAIQVILFAVIAVSGFLATGLTSLIAGVTGSGDVHIGHLVYAAAGQNAVLLLAALVAAALGVSAYRQMDDRKGIPLRVDLLAAIRGKPIPAGGPHMNGNSSPAPDGLLIAFEGGEGAGKTTQARMLAIWLREQGFDVVTTREPGATRVGMRLRALLLDTSHAGMSPRAEALMYAADRAEHVASVIAPALKRGAIVITDRYVDSSLAYQGAGRGLPVDEVAELNNWATDGLVPDLTILLDLPPHEGLSRRARSADRLEAEPLVFHERVREEFLALSRAEPERYLVLDASRPADELTAEIQETVRGMLPDPVPPTAEAATGSLPAVGRERGKAETSSPGSQP
ncbi:MAG TPA: dTMP kinase [Streptosporangiaceae bacterium]|nr:dTMP kinase [Streptosporangiaceae bacterium]